MDSKAEPLLEDEERLTILPIKYQDMWDCYKKHEAAVWHAHEVDVARDKSDWDSLSANEKHFIKHILAFFASSDLIVADNLSNRFMREVKPVEAKCFYGFQLMMENIHSEVYSNMINAYITDENEKHKLFNAVKTVPCVGKKAAWAKKWIESSNVFAERLIAFALVEGIFFSGAFCSIYWLREEKKKMFGLAEGNDFIARDEGLHTDFACLLYRYIVNRVSQERFAEILRDAVEVEIEFITDALPCKLLGINAKMMIEYIKFIANRITKQLNYEVVYPGAKQPFGFMNKILLENSTNFFEHQVSEYKKNVHQVTNNSDDIFQDL